MSLIVSGLLLSATGCVCVGGGGACGPRGCAGGACQASCDPCESGDFYARNPLGRLIGLEAGCDSCSSGGGCKAGCGAGCGELYVDEWINERPMVDNCGCGECLQCGRQPVRSLLQLLWGEKYCGSCETSCDGGVDLASPIIHDGYDPGAWSANRGCNCGGHAPSIHHGSRGSSGPAVIESQPEMESTSPSPTAPAPVPDASTSMKTPTPAPPIPKSAMRLNPATRKVVR